MATQGQKLLAAGTAVLIAEPLLALAHTGGVGMIVGLVAGGIAYAAVDDFEQVSGREIPSLPVPRRQQQRAPGQHSLAYRMLNGKSARGGESAPAPATADGEKQTRAVYEDEAPDDFEGSRLGGSGTFVFTELLLEGWRPSYEQIFLARLEDGTDIFVSVDQLVHIALAGSTRQGKTSIIRQLLVQLCSIGACCILLDPHYTPYDVEIDEDWTPYTPYLRYDPLECKSFERMEHILRHTATTLLEKRKQRRGASQPVGKPIFIVIDEYPVVIAEKPAIQNYVAKLLREGAKYKIFLCVASQDFQVKTISPQAGGAIRDCYKTCLYVGGDKTTANVLLDGPVPQEVETMLGKGPVMLRCEKVKKAALAYTPFTDNPALYELLGPSTYQPAAVEDGPIDELETDEADEDEEEMHLAAPQDPLPEVVKRDVRRKAEEIDLKIAIALWNAGFNSRAKLAKALDIAENQASKLMGLMEGQGTDGRTDG